MATDMAHMSATRHWGLLNWLELPVWSAVLLSFLLLDLIIYWQHRLFHGLPLAWRFHRVHHSDTFCDVTTGIRFHPVEILASMVIKVAAVMVLGAPVAAVVFFEVVLNGTSLFNHANLKIRTTVDRAIRLLMVTPDINLS